jgi:tyrosine-protein kinase Etk/Wzc
MQNSASNNHFPFRENNQMLKKMVSKYKQYWYILLISAAFGFVAAYLVNTYKEKYYRVRSVLLIHEDRTFIPLMSELGMIGARSNVYNEAAKLESRSLIDRVLQKSGVEVTYYLAGPFRSSYTRQELYRDTPFRVNFDRNHLQLRDKLFTITIIDANWYELSPIKGVEGLTEPKSYFFGQKIEGKNYSFSIDMVLPYESRQHKNQTYQFIINDMESLSETYWKALKVTPLRRESSIVEITYDASNLQRAQDFVNLLIDSYIEQNLEEKNHTAQNTIQFIDSQIAITSGNLNATEGRLQNFREKQQHMDIGLISTQLLNQLEELDKERSIEEVKRRYYKFLLEYLNDARDFSEVFGPSALGIEDPLLNNLVVELSKLHTERGRLRLVTTERSPSVVAIDQNIQQVRSTLEENLKSIYSASDILMSELDSRISRIEQRIGELPRTERELLGIQRLFNITDATYNFLLEKQAEAGIALASNMPDHKIVDSARFLKIVSPFREMNYALAIFITLILPIVIIWSRDYFNTRIVSKEEITSVLGFPVIGIVPRFKPLMKNGEVDVLIFDNPFSPITEAFRNIRSNLHFFTPKTENNLIVVSSARSGEGKTFTAINLAAALSMLEVPTLYIDADIRKTTTNRFTERMLDIGLSNYLIGRTGLADIINPSRYNDNMYIMNSGIRSPNPAELLESQAMNNLLKQELKEFKYVIIDTSPLGMVADAQPLIANAVLSIFVLRHNYSQHSDLEFIKDYSIKAGLKNLVVVVNDVRRTQKGYGYGLDYSRSYGLGYGEPEKNKKKLVSRHK